VDPVEADFAEYVDAVDAGRSSVVPLSVAAGRVAEVLPTSPDLAAWLACSPAGGLEDGALAGAASAYRRMAAWAQAGELAVVAQMASRSALIDKATGTGPDGRPEKVPADAYGQVSLALTLSQAGAEWWTNLAVDLQWRLAATGLALREGVIDLARAKAIAEATGPLDDAKARAVQDRVLPRAGDQTTGQLRASLRRAVITADPEGAERRREQAERRAKVTLYPDAEGTASLSGQNLPGIRAAAAFARITALARALKAAGSDGGIDLLRSKVLLGLLLGTLPYIPPPPDGPPDPENPPDIGGQPDPNSPPATGPAASRPAGPGEDSSPHLDDWPWNNDPAPGKSSPRGNSAGSGSTGQESGEGSPRDSSAASGFPGQEPGESSPGEGAGGGSCGQESGEGSPRDSSAGSGPGSGSSGQGPGESSPGENSSAGGGSCGRESGDNAAGRAPGAGEDPEPGPYAPWDAGHQPGAIWDGGDDRDPAGQSPEPGPVPWPDATAFLPPGPAALHNLPPAGSGFLDLRLHWLTLAHGGPEPGYLTRLGPVTPGQAGYLALLAAADPAVEWRTVVTDSAGRVVAVTRIRNPHASAGRARAGPARASPRTPSSLVRRVTVIISTDELSAAAADRQRPGETTASVLAAIITAARQAADRAAARAAADAAAGGCAHAQASHAYQVPARLREFINLRDLTCRFPTCRQPAARCDADHTKPHDQGGPTCLCNLGPLCRYHHQLKQHQQWHLDQPAPGNFTWTTPTGRTYNIQPDPQAA
jgi:hypothetical protein